MREREKGKMNQSEADRLYELKQRELDQRAMELQEAEENCRKAINMATASYNSALVSASIVYSIYTCLCSSLG